MVGRMESFLVTELISFKLSKADMRIKQDTL